MLKRHTFGYLSRRVQEKREREREKEREYSDYRGRDEFRQPVQGFQKQAQPTAMTPRLNTELD